MLTEETSGASALSYSLTSSVFASGASATYYVGNQPLPRTITPMRRAYEVITTLKDTYILVNGLTEYDLWSRVGAKSFYGLKNPTFFDTTIRQLLDGSEKAMGTAFTGVRIYKNALSNDIESASGIPSMGRTRVVQRKTGVPPASSFPSIREVYVNPGGPVGGDIASPTTPGGPGAADSPGSNIPGRRNWS